MHILFLSPEVLPYKRVGGLAEVARDLPLALGEMGHTVGVVTPKPRLSPLLESRLEKMNHELEVPVSWKKHHAEVFRHPISQGVTNYLIGHEHLFDREGLYGNAYGEYEDNAERFIFYSRACLELARVLGWQVDIFHANDWTTGLVPVYLKTLFAKEPLFEKTASLMTVHNLGRQGLFWHYDMPLTGLGWEYFTPEAMEFYGQVNFLKGGLVFADMITTVSHRYAQEILTPEMGAGLDGVLRSRAGQLEAVTNGIDYREWNPHIDKRLAANYSVDNMQAKEACRMELARLNGLDTSGGRAMVAVVGRLVDRKGLDLISEAMEQMLARGIDVVVMGFGEDHYHVRLQELARQNQGRIGITIGYDSDSAHKIMAGADMILMPCRYEPCGLHQMQAMRYGTVPVVRATGGLDETVSEGPEGNGFKFGPYQADEMLAALDRALHAFRDGNTWQGIMKRGMASDFSWASAAPAYVDIYNRAIELAAVGREQAQ